MLGEDKPHTRNAVLHYGGGYIIVGGLEQVVVAVAVGVDVQSACFVYRGMGMGRGSMYW